jgi:hypothetical protein
MQAAAIALRRGPWRAGRKWAAPENSRRTSSARRSSDRDHGEESPTEIGRSYNVSAATISRLTDYSKPLSKALVHAGGLHRA